MANSKTSGAPDGKGGVASPYNTPRKGGVGGGSGQSYPPGVGPGKQMTDKPKVISVGGSTETPYKTPRKAGI